MATPAWSPSKKKTKQSQQQPLHVPAAPASTDIYASAGSSSSSLSLPPPSADAPYLTHLVRHHGQYTLTAPPNLGKMRRGSDGPHPAVGELSENAMAVGGGGAEGDAEGTAEPKKKIKKKKKKKGENNGQLEASIIQAVLNAGRTPSPNAQASGETRHAPPPMERSTSGVSMESTESNNGSTSGERTGRRRRTAAAAQDRAMTSSSDAPEASLTPTPTIGALPIPSPSLILDSHSSLSGPISSSPPPPAYIPPPPPSPTLAIIHAILPDSDLTETDQSDDIFAMAWEEDRLNGIALEYRVKRDFVRRWGGEMMDEFDELREIESSVLEEDEEEVGNEEEDDATVIGPSESSAPASKSEPTATEPELTPKSASPPSLSSALPITDLPASPTPSNPSRPSRTLSKSRFAEAAERRRQLALGPRVPPPIPESRASGLKRKKTTTERLRDSLLVPASAAASGSGTNGGSVLQELRERYGTEREQEKSIQEEKEEDEEEATEEEETEVEGPARTVVNARQLFLEAAERRRAAEASASTPAALPPSGPVREDDEITPTASSAPKPLPFPGSPSPPPSPTTPTAPSLPARLSTSNTGPPLPRRPPPRPPTRPPPDSPSSQTRRHSRPPPPPPVNNPILTYIPQGDRDNLVAPLIPDRLLPPQPPPPPPVASSSTSRKPLPVPPRQSDKVDAFTAFREREREYTLGVLEGSSERRGGTGAVGGGTRQERARPNSDTSSLEVPPPAVASTSGEGEASTSMNTTATNNDDYVYTDLDLLLARLDRQGEESGTNYDELLLVGEVLGPAKAKGAKEEDIESLPVARVELERRRIDKNGKVKQKLAVVGVRCIDCNICLTRFRVDDYAVALPRCLHVFHSKCIQSWLMRSQQCPLCREDVFERPNIEI